MDEKILGGKNKVINPFFNLDTNAYADGAVSSKNKESKFSSDEENSSSSNEENEMIDHVRNLKFIGIEPSNLRSSQSQPATHDDRKKVCKSKEDEVRFERDVITNQADNIIAETGRTQSRCNRVVKLIELTEEEEDYRAVKTIELVRDNKYIDKIEYKDDLIENGSNNQHGRKKYNLRSRRHDVDLQTVNVVEADSSSHVRVGVGAVSQTLHLLVFPILHLQFSLTTLMF